VRNTKARAARAAKKTAGVGEEETVDAFVALNNAAAPSTPSWPA